MKKYEYLEHTADIKFQAFGKNLKEVFANSALAMFHAMYDKKVNSATKINFKVKGKDIENLLYNFLEEFLYLMDIQNFFLARIDKIKINEKNLILEAEVSGDDAKNYKISLDVKAITYNEMFVKKIKNNWVAQVVLDV